MNQRFVWLHGINFAMRFLATVCVFAYLIANGILAAIPAFLICAAILSIAFAIWREYVRLDRTLRVTLQQAIVQMPLFDLVEALNQRDDIKRLVINELEED